MALLIYIDESGQLYQIDEGPYVVASVIVDESELYRLETAIRDIILSINSRFKLGITEIHAKHLVKGNKPWNNVSMKDRAKVFQDIAKVIASLNIVLNIVAAYKDN